MGKFLSLLKLQINARYGLSYMLYNFKSDRKTFWKGLGLGIVIILSLGEVLGIYTYMMYHIFSAAKALNMQQMILTMAAVAAGVMVLVFGIFYILGYLFLAKDTEFLASLPLPQGSVFLSKFMLVLLGEYPFALFLMLPPVIIYGAGTHKGILYYITALFCTLFLPLIPLTISAVLSLLLMSVVSRSARRDLITIVGSIILIIAFIGGQNYLISRIPQNDENLLAELLKSSGAIIEYIGRAFPPSVWITRALSGNGAEAVINLLYLVLASLGALAAVYFIASFIYQRGASAQLETRANKGSGKLTYESSSHVATIFKNEWRIILRTPIYALNSLVVIVMAPLMLLLPAFGGSIASDPDIKFIFDLVQSSGSQSGVLLVVGGIVSVFSLINPAISSTFSREGRNFWILMNIPVRVETQVFGKLLAGYSISLAAVVLSSVAVMFSFKISPYMALMIMILSASALIPVSVVNILIDFKRPKLTWNNPQEAIKQNMNVMLGMLAGVLVLSVFGLAGYFINRLNINVYQLFGLMLAIILPVSWLSVYLLRRVAEAGYKKIEI